MDIDADEDLLGLTIGDLQEDVEINDGQITGTLKYVTGYTGFSGDPEEQEGNYLVLHFGCSDPDADGATISTFLTNGVIDHPQTLDPDGLLICRITDKMTQTIEVVASKEGYADVKKVYELTGLTLEAAPENDG